MRKRPAFSAGRCGFEVCDLNYAIAVFKYDSKYTVLEIDPNISPLDEYLQNLNHFILSTATRFVYSIDSNFCLPRMLLQDRKS